jgi:hypothetical protein
MFLISLSRELGIFQRRIMKMKLKNSRKSKKKWNSKNKKKILLRK